MNRPNKYFLTGQDLIDFVRKESGRESLRRQKSYIEILKEAIVRGEKDYTYFLKINEDNAGKSWVIKNGRIQSKKMASRSNR